MKFVDVKNDVAFRKIFGNEKKTKILISFLNAALKLEGDHLIKEVTIANPYQFPRIAGEKASIIDVRAKDVRGRQFVVEMQVAETDGFDKRVQYYTSRDYSMQIERGEEYPKLKPTYFIGILDFDYFDSEDYLSHHIILNGKTFEHKLKDIQFTFIELEKFNKEVHELETLIDKWTFFIKNAEELEVIPDNVDDDGLLEAYHDADRHSWKKEELIAYDNASIAEQDAIGKITFGIKKALKEKNYKIIEKCFDKNMAPEDIADITDLRLEKVLETIEKIKKKKGG
ncbi:MAG TPA: Rpn family recombination-promoting nuclease/putative transposase [Bacteroidetes bacterium]|nr:Rpn family recombination-promoting nuclease/putative transposase [Bacteroidota bacterium]